MRGEEGGEGAGLALKYRLTSCTVQFTNTLTFLLHIYTSSILSTVPAVAAILCPISFHTDVTMYEPRSPPAPLPPPSPPFGSRFLVTGVGMSEGRVGVVDEDVVVVGVAAVVTSVLLFLGLGV